MKKLLVLTFTFFTCCAFAQTPSTTETPKGTQKEIPKNIPVDEPAEFPGGEKALSDFISKNLNYPKDLQDKGIGGQIYVRFVVKADSTIGDIQVIKSDGWEELNAEAMRVISIMPKWHPHSQGEKTMDSPLTIPILFSAASHSDMGLMIQGRSAYNDGDYKAAIRSFLKAIKKDPYDAKAIYYCGDCYVQLGEITKACEMWSLLTQMKNSSADKMIKKHCN